MNQVMVYSDNDFGAPVEGLHIMSVKVGKASRTTQAPIENGETSTDYKVIQPIRISVNGYVDCSDQAYGKGALDDLNKMFLNRKFKFYSVVTRDAEYNNLMLKDCPHDEESDNLTMAYFHIDFEEAMVVQGRSAKASNSDNDNFTNKGYTAVVKKGAFEIL